MLKAGLRLWLAFAVLWIGYSLYENHGKLSYLTGRDWRLALEYRLNNIACDLKLMGLCKTLSISPWQQVGLNERFTLIVKLIGVPIGMLLLTLSVAWAIRGITVLFGLPILILLTAALTWVLKIGFR